ncbi:hypothetical protein FRC11_007848 [Ceratobasidium sp. 423]|nr:hypothetical protein FRC11_007848 [Ceratobasidium sp. 423]
MFVLASEQMLTQAWANNAHHDYGREITAQLEPPEVSNPLSNQEPNNDKEDLSPANQLLDHLLVCNSIDYHAQYLSSELPLLKLRDMVTQPKLHSSDHSLDVSPDPNSSGDDVHHPDPEPLGHNMIEPNANSPTSPQVVPEPITTDW